MSWLKVTSESRMSALRRRCALMEGLICFFTSHVRGAHIIGGTSFCRETRNGVKTFLKTLGNFSDGGDIDIRRIRSKANHELTRIDTNKGRRTTDYADHTDGRRMTKLECRRTKE